jgi:hypothetical protein
MSLKVKIGSAVAALALVGAVGVAPANASTGATVQTTVNAAKACIQGSGTIKSKATCVVNTVKSAVSSIVTKIPSLGNIVNTIKNAVSGIKLPSLGGFNLSNLIGGLNLGSLRL